MKWSLPLSLCSVRGVLSLFVSGTNNRKSSEGEKSIKKGSKEMRKHSDQAADNIQYLSPDRLMQGGQYVIHAADQVS